VHAAVQLRGFTINFQYAKVTDTAQSSKMQGTDVVVSCIPTVRPCQMREGYETLEMPGMSL
jgi:hypothetical protein